MRGGRRERRRLAARERIGDALAEDAVDLRAALLQRAEPLGRDGLEADDVKAEFGLDDFAGLPRLEREQRVAELLDDLAARDLAQVPSFGGRAPVVGSFLGDCREILPGLDALQEILRLLLRISARPGSIPGTVGDHDVPRVCSGRYRELERVPVVIR